MSTPYQRTAAPCALFGADQRRPDSCLQFADSVGLLAAAKGSNFVYSPLSIRAALSLAAAGSNGQTLDQFLSFLGSPTVKDLNVAVDSILASVRATGPDENGGEGCRLSFANGVWVDQSLTLKPSFQEIATSLYGAVANSVDFANGDVHIIIIILLQLKLK